MALIDPWRQGAAHKWQPHQLVWLAAAETLPFYERMIAYRDMASLMDIPVEKVTARAKKLRNVNKAYRVAAE